MILFRGTQTPDTRRTGRGTISYSPSLLVAVVYSAVPGDVWARREVAFAKGSSVEAVQLARPRVLDLRAHGTYCSLADILSVLDYPRGISDDEVLRIHSYIHNRLIGKASGGPVIVRVYDEDGEEEDAHDVPLSLRRPETLVSWYARDAYRKEPGLDAASLLVADLFAFVDAPAVRRAALAMGFDVIAHLDVFDAGVYAAEKLLGATVRDLHRLGVREAFDLTPRRVAAHETFRVIEAGAVVRSWVMPVHEAIGLLGDF